MRIRAAGENDLPCIVEIYNQAVAQRGATADLTPVSIESRRAWFREHDSQTWPVAVAQDGESIIGWCSLSAYRPGRMALRHNAELSYYVHAAHRRTGVGSALIQWAIGRCPGLQIKNLFTLVLEVNAPSIRLLEKSGFELWGRMPRAAEIDGRECAHLIHGRRVWDGN